MNPVRGALLLAEVMLAALAFALPAFAQPKEEAADAEVTYAPPLRGAPQRRIGGSSRGPEGPLPGVFVLAPDHVGLTTSEHPSLYWYITGPTRVRVELTLIDDKNVAPVIEVPVEPAQGEGVQRLRLSDMKVALESGIEYQWTVSLVPSDSERSNDVISGGVIKRVAMPEQLGARLASARPEERPRLLAAAGMWYDALAELSELIESNPGDARLRDQRARLLEQVGLRDAAAYDRRAR